VDEPPEVSRYVTAQYVPAGAPPDGAQVVWTSLPGETETNPPLLEHCSSVPLLLVTQTISFRVELTTMAKASTDATLDPLVMMLSQVLTLPDDVPNVQPSFEAGAARAVPLAMTPAPITLAIAMVTSIKRRVVNGLLSENGQNRTNHSVAIPDPGVHAN
jgi:hypothetical protein